MCKVSCFRFKRLCSVFIYVFLSLCLISCKDVAPTNMNNVIPKLDEGEQTSNNQTQPSTDESFIAESVDEFKVNFNNAAKELQSSYFIRNIIIEEGTKGKAFTNMFKEQQGIVGILNKDNGLHSIITNIGGKSNDIESSFELLFVLIKTITPEISPKSVLDELNAKLGAANKDEVTVSTIRNGIKYSIMSSPISGIVFIIENSEKSIIKTKANSTNKEQEKGEEKIFFVDVKKNKNKNSIAWKYFDKDITIPLQIKGHKNSLFLIGLDHPNGLRFIVLNGDDDMRYNLDLGRTKGQEDLFNNYGDLRDIKHDTIQAATYDFDQDGNDELIIGIGDSVSYGYFWVFKYNSTNPQVPYTAILNGFFQREIIFSQNSIEVPIGSQGRFDEYTWKNGTFIKAF